MQETATAETRWVSCPKCSRRARPGQAFCELCGEQIRESPVGGEEPRRGLHCEGCGASILVPESERTVRCAFCGAPYVAAGEAAAGRHAPEFVLPFTTSRAEAERAFRAWMQKGGWFRPGDLALRSVLAHMRGVYIPFWSFTMRSESSWSARIGEHWYETITETYTDMVNGKPVVKTRTRRVQRTEWYPLEGKFHQFHSNCLVPASRGIDRASAERIQPFPVAEASRYSPHFLSGWLCEEYSLAREEAARIAEGELRGRERRDIAAFLPGDVQEDLAATTELHDPAEDLVLLPVWILAYRYRAKTYRYLLNGATGKEHGEKPLSGARIAALIIIVLAVIALVFLLGALLRG
jgi:hypothetical protein